MIDDASTTSAGPGEGAATDPAHRLPAGDAYRQKTLAGESVGTIELVAEQLRVGKRRVVTGRVDVRTVTDTVEETVRSTLRGESVEVVHVPVGREVEVAPTIRTEGDVTIIPVLEEVLVVETRLVLKEEIHIRRISRSDTVETTVPLRRQRAVVERHDAGQSSDAPDPTPEERTP